MSIARQSACIRYSRFGTAAAMVMAIASTARAVPPGSGSPPPGCGVACAPAATITLDVPTGGFFGLIANQGYIVQYTVKNTKFADLTGKVTVKLNGQVVPDSGNPGTITLAPQQTFSGTVIVNHPAAGVGSFTADYSSPTCQFEVGGRYCLPDVYATTTASVSVAPDQDNDGMSDVFEQQLLQTYAPLMLFSKDHGQQEQYAPIDVLDFIHASSLISKDSAIPGIMNSVLKQSSPPNDPEAILKFGGAIVAPTATGPAPTYPRNIYLSPTSKAQHGTAWPAVLASKKTGLYGHVVMIPVSAIGDPDLAQELSANYCSDTSRACDRSVLKIEYWQFFGYSHDFEVPASVTAAQFFIDGLLPIPLPPLPIAEFAKDIIDHGGDWCTVQLYVDPVEPNPEKAILAVYHYAHGLQFQFDLTRTATIAAGPIPTGVPDNPTQYQMKQFQGENITQPVNLPFQNAGTTQAYKNAQNNILRIARTGDTAPYVHPVVYIEWGGHEFFPSPGWSFEFASKHGGDGYSYFAAVPPNVGEVGNSMPAVPQADTVVGFAGYWGYYGWENHNKPPQGPPLHKQWQWLSGGPVPSSVRPANAPF